MILKDRDALHYPNNMRFIFYCSLPRRHRESFCMRVHKVINRVYGGTMKSF